MKLRKSIEEGVVVLDVAANRIDAANAIHLKDDFAASIEGELGRVLMDLGQVDFMDSSGLGAVVAAMKSLGPSRKLEVCNLSPAVDKVFTLTRMNTIFVIHPDKDAALTREHSNNGASAA